MNFTSLEFVLFFPVVFAMYWGLGSARMRAQNVLLLIASYVFYGWWDWRFLLLIGFSSAIDFAAGLKLEHTDNPHYRKLILTGSLITNLGLLGYFKYANFFIDNFVRGFTFLGAHPDPHSLDIILPVGISFYTFQSLSYTIDVYRKKVHPTHDALAFFAYVSFFPQLVAGPIERAASLLPQFLQRRVFSYSVAKDGLLQLIWGLFKKVVIADSCAIYADAIFDNYPTANSSALIIGAIYFSFQIYADFSGYSDMAIGAGKLMGFRLMTNFTLPYFSRDIAEFWRRWHISLTTWFRDYVYIPLGGSKQHRFRNVVIVFLVSGFWHGPSWNFIVWGGLNALLFLPLMAVNRNRRYVQTVAAGSVFPTIREAFQMILTFSLVTIMWIFFRAETLNDALMYVVRMVRFDFLPLGIEQFHYLPLIGLLIVWEWIMRVKSHGLEMDHFPNWSRWMAYIGIVWLILYFWGKEEPFIYFQF